ncbi:PKD domain-containing protein [Bradyrhizobium sp. NBAIM08]
MTAWFWAFDDGTIDNSNAISPVHKYTGSGADKATLTVTNSAGSSSVGPK